MCTHACVYGRGGAEAAPVAELLQRRPDPALFTTKTKDVKGVTIDASSAASFANDSTPALPHRVHLACEASHNRIPNTTDTHIRCTCKHKHTHTHTRTQRASLPTPALAPFCLASRGHAGNKLKPAAADAIRAACIARPAIFLPSVVPDTWLPVAIRVRFVLMHRRRHAPERAGLESIAHRHLRPDLFDVLGPSLQACTRASEWACARALHSAARLCVRAWWMQMGFLRYVCLTKMRVKGGMCHDT